MRIKSLDQEVEDPFYNVILSVIPAQAAKLEVASVSSPLTAHTKMVDRPLQWLLTGVCLFHTQLVALSRPTDYTERIYKCVKREWEHHKCISKLSVGCTNGFRHQVVLLCFAFDEELSISSVCMAEKRGLIQLSNRGSRSQLPRNGVF